MKDSSERRTFLRYLAIGAASSALPISAFAQEENVRKRIYTYKTVENCEIRADVMGPPIPLARSSCGFMEEH
jgi:hypothetical protein